MKKIEQYRYKLSGHLGTVILEGEFEARNLRSAKTKASKLVNGVDGNWYEHDSKPNTWVKTRNTYYSTPKLTLTFNK